MTEQNVAVTPNDEGVEEIEQDTTSGQLTGNPFGLTDDGTQYSIESPEVVKFKELYPEVTDEVAISSVVGLHDIITDGGETNPEAIEVVEMIKEKLMATSGDAPDQEPDADGLDGEASGGDAPDEQGSETSNQ